MNISEIRDALRDRLATGFDLYQRRPENYQLILPILHEDGDMVDIYLVESPVGNAYVRICDFGMTLMRLSYAYEINSESRMRIFESILINNGVQNDQGNLFIDTEPNRIYEGILQFAGCVQKVCSMTFWNREFVRSAFYEDLAGYVTAELGKFSPVQDESPIPEYPISVDWSLTHNDRKFYLFGVRGNNKALNVAVSLLEFQKQRLPFISIVVHENMEELGRKERVYLTSNADRQYPALNDFREKITDDMDRLAGVLS